MRTSLTTAVAAACAVVALTGCSSQSQKSAATSSAAASGMSGSASVSGQGGSADPTASGTSAGSASASGGSGASGGAGGAATAGGPSSGTRSGSASSGAFGTGADGTASPSSTGGAAPAGSTGTSGDVAAASGATDGAGYDAPVTSTPPGNTAPAAAAPAAGSTTTNPTGNPTRVYVVDTSGRTIVNASLIPNYLDSRGVLAPPAGTAGWYAERGWVQPGRPGTSVLVGHVTYGGAPDTFYNLIHATPGDKVIVSYSSGDRVAFTVTGSRGEAKSAVSKDRSIWDATSSPSLRLITCDPATPMRAGHFSGNWVVWAVPA